MSALRFGDARVMALMAALAGFSFLIAGFDNRGLTARMRVLLNDGGYSTRQATYDLRRLRRKHLITRIPGTHPYQLTDTGRAVAVLEAPSAPHGKELTRSRWPRAHRGAVSRARPGRPTRRPGPTRRDTKGGGSRTMIAR